MTSIACIRASNSTVEITPLPAFSPLDRFFSLLTVFTIQGIGSMQNVEMAFDTTREEILKLFKICHNVGDYTYIDPNVLCVGLNPGIKSAVDKFAGSTLANCIPSFGVGEACFGMKGIGIAFPIKFAFLTPLLILKGLIEILDPLISLARVVQMAMKIAGICLPIPAIAWAMLPINIFIPPPFGIGIGPPLLPLGMVYMALGFGMLDLSLDVGGELSLDLSLQLAAAPDLNPPEKTCTSDDVKAFEESDNAKKAKESSKEPIPKSSTEMVMAKLISNLNNEPLPKESLNDFLD